MKSHLSFAMRLYRIDQILQEKGSATFGELLGALQCSSPTLKRDLRYLREKAGAKIVYVHESKRYMYAKKPGADAKRARSATMMPTAWFSPRELFALGAMLRLADAVERDPQSVTASEMRPLKSRLMAMLPDELTQKSPAELLKRVKVIVPAFGRVDEPFFSIVGMALVRRLRLRLTYFTRNRDSESAREVSPLRLVHWRGRWYLDAWCHETGRMKTFSVENIRSAQMLQVACRAVAMREIEEKLDGTYGIFSGGQTKTAVIAIDGVMAHYERTTVWHPDQRLEVNADGTLTLQVPYAKETELAGDILRLGEHARVISPQSLIDCVRDKLRATLEQYENQTEDGKRTL